MDTSKWNLNQNAKTFIEANAFEMVVYKMSAVSRWRWFALTYASMFPQKKMEEVLKVRSTEMRYRSEASEQRSVGYLLEMPLADVL